MGFYYLFFNRENYDGEKTAGKLKSTTHHGDNGKKLLMSTTTNLVDKFNYYLEQENNIG